MSGTSLDGIDVAVCRFENKTIELLTLYSEAWPESVRAQLMDFARLEYIEMNALVRAHFELAELYGNAVEAALRIAEIDASRVRAIGLHGQTIRHLPPHSDHLQSAGTFQLGSGAALAAKTGIDVVSDFRSADVALGGQGAPLVPMFDRYFLQSDSHDRLAVNIGGIANVTWLPAYANESEILAFDCGPGNMLLDTITRMYFYRAYDEDGLLARSGAIDVALLQSFLDNPFFSMSPPKSTGRELFSETFLQPVFDRISDENLSPEDALATLTELTAKSIAMSFDFIERRSNRLELIVSGGGAFNTFLLERLKKNVAEKNARVELSDAVGIPAKAKEAIAFAFFANAWIEEIPIHLPGTTGASRRVPLGNFSRAK